VVVAPPQRKAGDGARPQPCLPRAVTQFAVPSTAHTHALEVVRRPARGEDFRKTKGGGTQISAVLCFPSTQTQHARTAQSLTPPSPRKWRPPPRPRPPLLSSRQGPTAATAPGSAASRRRRPATRISRCPPHRPSPPSPPLLAPSNPSTRYVATIRFGVGLIPDGLVVRRV
jgi:hypothetical protein